MTGAAKPFTVIAYVDGDYGVRTYTARVMARPGDAWPSAVRHWAQEIERTEGPRAAFRFVEAVTEVETFHGHPRSEGERGRPFQAIASYLAPGLIVAAVFIGAPLALYLFTS